METTIKSVNRAIINIIKEINRHGVALYKENTLHSEVAHLLLLDGYLKEKPQRVSSQFRKHNIYLASSDYMELAKITKEHYSQIVADYNNSINN